MKKIFNLWLMAALVCGLGLSVTSCKDDDDDNNNKSEEQKEQEQQQLQTKFWSVVGQLVSTDDYTEDYADKTFEPTIGTPESEGSLTRLVATNDMQTAAQRFADLVGASGIDENTQTYTYDDPEVGTLTYTRGGTADEWATVDVSIKQVPKLRKIIYRQGGEGTNASFTGKAWYRFGDVVSRQVDGQTEYWICVRPAFGPESKGDSHWACLNALPLKNQKYYKASDGREYWLPTGVGTSKEHMQNLAEMLYAICYPEQWYDNANSYHTDGRLWGFSGLPIFTDFSKAKLQYHNQYFWQKVQDAWEAKGIADKALNVDLGALADRINRDGINLLYNGYSWWFLSSWDCKLWQASYTNGSKDAEKNLHHAEYSEPEKNMKGVKFDCRSMGENSDNYRQFFGDGKYRWVFRTATGKQLNGGTQPAATAQLQGGCTDVYRYYDQYPGEWTKNDNAPEISEKPVEALAAAKVGAIVGLDGKFYENKTNCEAAGTQAVAMVVYLSTDGQRVEKDQPWTGLALALSDVTEGNTSQFKWTDATNANDCNELCTSAVGGGVRTDGDNAGDVSTDYLAAILDGWAMTKRMAQHDCYNHSHPAAERAWSTANRPEGFSEWFMPSVGQVILALKGMGYERQYTSNYSFGKNQYSWSFNDNGHWLWQEAGVPEAALSGNVATTTQSVSFANEFFTFSGRTFLNQSKYRDQWRVRRMIAFGTGGTTNPQAVPQPIEPRPGAILTHYGYCFASMDDFKVYYNNEATPAGMVVYYSKTKRVEEGLNYNGLAIGLKDYTASEWCADKNAGSRECSIAVGGAANYANALAGGTISELLAGGSGGHDHPAAKRSNVTFQNFSKGFLPSAGQWILAMQGLGYTWNAATGQFNTAGKWPWADNGLAQYATVDVAEYWTSTEQKDDGTYKALAVTPNGTTFKLHDKSDKLLVRPFFAFGHFGTE